MNVIPEIENAVVSQPRQPIQSDFTHAQFEREKTERIKALSQALTAVSNIESTAYDNPRSTIINLLNQCCSEQFFVKYVCWLFLLFWPVVMLSQPDPPPLPPATNDFAWCAAQICFNETSNIINCQTNIQNVSTNGYPWGNPLNNFYDLSWNCCTYCPDQKFQVFVWWTWGRQMFSTNFPVTTNIVVFHPYYVPGTNEVVHYHSYHTDGNTLAFAHNITGPWNWSGSPNYRQPSYLETYERVRGVSTDGSVNPVHLWLTNETWENGVLIGKEVITR